MPSPGNSGSPAAFRSNRTRVQAETNRLYGEEVHVRFLRAAVSLVALAVAVGALRQPSFAYSYCPVSVGAVQALQFSAADAYRRAVDRRFGVELKSEQLRAATVELSMAANGAIYRTHFNNLAFNGGVAVGLFSFDGASAVDYVWVSRVNDGQHEVSCPLDPFRTSHEYFNDRHLTRTELASRQADNERIIAASRQAPTSRPEIVAQIRRDCAEPDQTPTINHEVPPDAGDLRALKGPTPVVVLVHVGPNGEPLDTQLVQSSAFPRLNDAVLASAQQSTYNPATIDCMPTTGIYLFKTIFGT